MSFAGSKSSSILHQQSSRTGSRGLSGRAPGESREVACSSHAFVAQSFLRRQHVRVHAGVTQLAEWRLLSDPMGVRVLWPAYLPGLPREAWEEWRNGKRSGPRPRGPREGRGSSTLPLGTRTPNRLRAGGTRVIDRFERTGESRRPSPTTRPSSSSRATAFGPESFGYRSKRLGRRPRKRSRVRLPASDAPLRGHNTPERFASISAEPDVEGYRLSSGLSRVRVPPDPWDP